MIAHVKMLTLNYVLYDFKLLKATSYAHLSDVTQLNSGEDKNPEVGAVWLEVSLKMLDRNAIPFCKAFLGCNGRMKYIRPVYRAFYVCAGEEAQQFFESIRRTHHPVASRLVERDLKKLAEEKNK